jgi:hypothetical protein
LEVAIDDDRIAHGKAPMKAPIPEVNKREIKVSTTDPDSGYLTREGKPQGFYYLDHRTVDGKHNIILGLAGWGLCVLIHGLAAYEKINFPGLNSRWEKRAVEKRLGRKL